MADTKTPAAKTPATEEFDALQATWNALERLDDGAVIRILKYVLSRKGIEPMEAFDG